MIFNALIVEDEQPAYEKLESFLQNFDDEIKFNILHSKYLEQAIEITQKQWNKLDVVFLDITLISKDARGLVPDAGVKFLEKIEENAIKDKKDIPFKIIITSAWDKYGQTAFHRLNQIKTSVIGYALKSPTNYRTYDEMLKEAIDKFLEITNEETVVDILLNNFNRIKVTKKIRGREIDFFLQPEHILYIKGEAQYHKYYLTEHAQKCFQEELLEMSIDEKIKREMKENITFKNACAAVKIAAEQQPGNEKKIAQLKKEKKEIKENLEDELNLKRFMFKKELKMKIDKGTITLDSIKAAKSIGNFCEHLNEKNKSTFKKLNKSLIVNLNYLGMYEKFRKWYYVIDNTTEKNIKKLVN